MSVVSFRDGLAREGDPTVREAPVADLPEIPSPPVRLGTTNIAHLETALRLTAIALLLRPLADLLPPCRIDHYRFG